MVIKFIFYNVLSENYYHLFFLMKFQSKLIVEQGLASLTPAQIQRNIFPFLLLI